MARAIFKYICPDKEKMDKASFQSFITLFGLNTHGISSDLLFDVVASNKAYISDGDLHGFISDIPLAQVAIEANKQKVKEKVKEKAKKKTDRVRDEEEEEKKQHIPTISAKPSKEKKLEHKDKERVTDKPVV